MNPSLLNSADLAAHIVGERFCKAVLSSQRSTHSIKKVVIEPIERRFKLEIFESRQCRTEIATPTTLPATLDHYLPLFKQVDLYLDDAQCHMRTSATPWACSWSKAVNERKVDGHNRIKPYLFPEGTPHPFLVALDVMDRQGRVLVPMRRKFVQINTFLESINDLLEFVHERKKSFRIVDAGCGKGYLTFALAAHLLERYGEGAEVVGIDSRTDVIDQCITVKNSLRFTNLNFHCESIGSMDESLAPDFLIALHACNTATDVAIYKAIQMKALAIAVAPCCQHELAPLIPKTLFPMVFDHPILAQRAAAVLTDAIRCELLSVCGYRVKAVEFVDPEHTPKNTLIKAVYTDQPRSPGIEFLALRQQLGSGILLERLLIENGLVLCQTYLCGL